MGLRFYNTRTRRLEAFEPAAPPRVAMYVCGPTVYDEPHIGHARSAYVFDVIRRWLAYRRYKVEFVRNVTDVDDKIIQRAQQEHRPAEAVAEACLQSYHAALEQLGIRPPTQEPRATQYIDQMTEMIGKLLVNGIAYEAQGNVYFSVKHFAAYGKLSNRTTEELLAGTRGEPGEGKRDPLDFALWKVAKPGEPSWPSPWGAGRPGWHVECSAMSMHCLGAPQIDIHGGGLDLIFPHHENEIAQSEAASGQSPFANVWLHHGLLTINNQKMSKSLGNFVTVEDALAKCPHPDCLKIFFLKAHYRSPVDYSVERLSEAIENWKEFARFFELCRQVQVGRSGGGTETAEGDLYKRQRLFEESMDDDFNTPKALAVLFDLVNVGKSIIESGNPMKWFMANNLHDTLTTCGQTLGLFEQGMVETDPETRRRLESLIEERDGARKAKNFKRADEIRHGLEQEGFLLIDSAGKTLWVRNR